MEEGSEEVVRLQDLGDGMDRVIAINADLERRLVFKVMIPRWMGLRRADTDEDLADDRGRVNADGVKSYGLWLLLLTA